MSELRFSVCTDWIQYDTVSNDDLLMLLSSHHYLRLLRKHLVYVLTWTFSMNLKKQMGSEDLETVGYYTDQLTMFLLLKSTSLKNVALFLLMITKVSTCEISKPAKFELSMAKAISYSLTKSYGRKSSLLPLKNYLPAPAKKEAFFNMGNPQPLLQLNEKRLESLLIALLITPLFKSMIMDPPYD